MFGINLPFANNNQPQQPQPQGNPFQGFFQNVGNAVGGVGHAVLNTAINDAQDIGTGIRNDITSGSTQNVNQQLEANASALEAKAAALHPDDPQRANLLAQANQYRQQQSQLAKGQNEGFSPDIQDNYAGRALGGAAEIGTGADVLANGVPSMLNAAVHPIQLIKNAKDMVQGGIGALNGLKDVTGEDLAKIPRKIGDFVKNDASQSFKLPQKPDVTPTGPTFAGGESPVNTPSATTNSVDNSSQLVDHTGDTPVTPVPDDAHYSNPMYTTSQAPKDAVAQYNSVFQIPRNVAQNMKIKPTQVINTLINDGVTGKTVDELGHVANTITGDDGAFTKINRIMLGDLKTPIDVETAQTSVSPAVHQYLEGSPPGLTKTVTSQVLRELPKGGAINGSQAYAPDVFKTTQALDRLAQMYTRKAYTVMGDLTNPEYERAGQAIQEISNNFKDSLDKAITPEQYQAYKSDPRVIEQLKRVPAPIAERWYTNAKQFRDGRTIQAPYVALKNMVEDTNDAKLSAFTKWTNNMQAQQANNSQKIVQNATNFVASPYKTTINAIGGKVQNAISPMVDKSVEDLERIKTSGQSAQMTPPAATPTGNGLHSTLPASTAYQVGNNAGQPPSGQSQSTNPGSGGNITPYFANQAPDSTGHYQINTSIDPSTAPMSLQEFMKQRDQLTPGTPAYTKFVDDYEKNQTLLKNGLPSDIASFMRNAVPVQNNANTIIDDISSGKLPMDIFHRFDTFNQAQQYVDPKYQGYVTAIDGLNRGFAQLYQSSLGQSPSQNMLISPKDSSGQAQAKLLYMTNFFSGTFDQYKPVYSALSPSGSLSKTGQIQPAQIPTPDSGPQDFSGMIGGQMNVQQPNVSQPTFSSGQPAFK